MDTNIIFCFTGTGNSLKAAIDISEHLSNCRIIPMSLNHFEEIEVEAERIGFVFPVYFLGLPLQVQRFIKKLNFKNSGCYLFAVATCGRFQGNSLRQLNELLKQKEQILNYGNSTIMGDNAITFYNAKGSNASIENQYLADIASIANDIKCIQQKTVKKEIYLIRRYYNMQIKKVNLMGNSYSTSANCVGCGICEKVCPVSNIQISKGTPCFKHQCEQCMACIQLCPHKAINFKNKTNNRERYHNPHVTVNELIKFQNL